MKKTLKLLIFLVTVFSQLSFSCNKVSDSAPNILPAGKYETYYQSEKDAGDPIGINEVFADHTGQYSLIFSPEEIFIEKYRWEIDGKVLILNNYESYLKEAETDEIIETYEKYTQYFKILEFNENELRFELIKDVYEDGTEETFQMDEPYIWKRISE